MTRCPLSGHGIQNGYCRHSGRVIPSSSHLGISTGMGCDVKGEQFFRAFDTAFALKTISEFPYLLRYT